MVAHKRSLYFHSRFSSTIGSRTLSVLSKNEFDLFLEHFHTYRLAVVALSNSWHFIPGEDKDVHTPEDLIAVATDSGMAKEEVLINGTTT